MLPLFVLTIEDIGGRVGLGSNNLGDSGVHLIRVGLGIAGTAALAAIVAGGVTWMVSGADEQRRRRAKGIITYAVIGLIVIFLAWAIVTFVGGTTTEIST